MVLQTRSTLDDYEADFTKLNMSSIRDFDDLCTTLPRMTDFTEQIITYIARYVV